MYILHDTRSMRLIVRPVGVATEIVVENMSGNEGLEMQFSVRRSIGDSASTGQAVIFNLPDSIRTLIEGQGSRVGNIDDLIEDGTLWSVGEEASDDETAIASQQGYATIELQAGYDGSVSTIFSGTAIFTQTVPSASSSTPRRDSEGRFAKAVLGAGITTETTIIASSGIAQVALSQANETFAKGTDTFVILEHLRRVLKLGPGNCTPINWLKYLADAAGAINKNGQSLFSQTSVLSSSFTVTDNAAQQLEEFLRFTGLRYFVDDGQLWLLPRQGFIEGPIVTLEQLKEAPRRPRPGHLECKAFLTPAVAPGHLVRVDATDIDTTSSGVYRCDEVMHVIGSSAAEEADTTVHLSRRQPLA